MIKFSRCLNGHLFAKFNQMNLWLSMFYPCRTLSNLKVIL